MNISINNSNKGALLKIEIINRGFFLVAFMVFSAARIGGDALLYLFADYSGLPATIWKTITSALIFTSMLLYIFSLKFNEQSILEDLLSEEFFRDFQNCILLPLGIFVAHIIVPDVFLSGNAPKNIFLLLISDIISIYAIFTIIYYAYFLYKWLFIRRSSRTKIYLQIAAIGLAYYFSMDYVFYLIHVDIGYQAPTYFHLLVIVPVVGIFLAANRNSWIAILPRPRKFKLLLYTVLVIIFVGTASDFANDNESLAAGLDSFMPGLSNLGFLVYLYIIVYAIRLFFSCIATLPTSSILERRTSEISSLTYLNRIVSKTIDFDTLIDTVTQLALNSSGATAAWTEIYYKAGNSCRIGSMKFIEEEHINAMHRDPALPDRVRNLKSTMLIESIPEDKELYYISQDLKIARSMIATPLVAGEDKVGTLVVLHNDEYGLDHNDAKVLSAFSNNVSVALENARLVKDSIEKEHYKRELELARDMQRKLLPQQLPHIENYSLSAFSVPAEEVGGDFYDIGTLKDGRRCIIIGDVSGKGMNAAFYMAQLKGAALSEMKEATGPADLLKRINRVLLNSVEKKVFITINALTIDDGDGKISLARAGHMPAVIKNQNGIEILKTKGIGTCLVDSSKFDNLLEEADIKLHEGGLCLLFTDGLNELRDKSLNEYGMENLEKFLAGSNFENASQANDLLKQELQRFSKDQEQFDDLTVVSLMYHGSE